MNDERAELSTLLEEQMEIRQKVTDTCLQIIEACGESVSHIHRNERALSDSKLLEARKLIGLVRQMVKRHPSSARLAIVRDAMCEYVEASCLRSVVTVGSVPSYKSFNVEPDEYLLGLADLVGELRRLCFDLIRKDRLGDAESVFHKMEEVYELVISFEYPKQYVKGLRHKVDVDRRLLDDTRLILTQAYIAGRKSV
ncbi:MAG: hypothetical protein QW767_01140 [Thermoprotei archaeon]